MGYKGAYNGSVGSVTSKITFFLQYSQQFLVKLMFFLKIQLICCTKSQKKIQVTHPCIRGHKVYFLNFESNSMYNKIPYLFDLAPLLKNCQFKFSNNRNNYVVDPHRSKGNVNRHENAMELPHIRRQDGRPAPTIYRYTNVYNKCEQSEALKQFYL